MLLRIKSVTLAVIVGVLISCLITAGCEAQNNDVKSASSETKYYSSQFYTFNNPGYRFRTVLKLQDGHAAVFSKWQLDGNEDYIVYLHSDGDSGWNRKIILKGNEAELCDFAVADNGRIIATTGCGFEVYDLGSGDIIYRNKELGSLTKYQSPHVDRRGSDYVITTNECVYLISSDYSVCSMVEYTVDGGLADDNTYFYYEGKDYLALDNGPVSYYSLDFESKEVKYLNNNEDMGLDYRSALYNGYYNLDDNTGDIIRFDPGSQENVICSNTGNMLIHPATHGTGCYDVWFFFDDDHYAISYMYDDGYEEVVLISPDESLNLADRKRLTVKGYDATSDYALMSAAYIYNMTQDSYYLLVENYDIYKYGYQTAQEAQTSKLKLMQEFSSGNAPDIFYGNNFDYYQMGKGGLVLDLSPYLEGSSVLNEQTINPDIYRLFYEDGQCFSVFPGYSMFGLWSSEEFTSGNNNMSIEDMINSDYSARIFGEQYAADIADFAIRYSIRKLVKNDSFISKEELSQIVGFAVNNGNGPDSENSNPSTISAVAGHAASVYLGYVGSAKVFCYDQHALGNSPLRFVGFPSIGGASHVIYPYGLVAVSSGTKYPEACIEFFEILFSQEVQRNIASHDFIPANNDVFDEMLQSTEDLRDGDIDAYRDAVCTVDTVMINDWGLYNIIADEINSYYLQGRSIDSIADSLRSRIVLYYEENYS